MKEIQGDAKNISSLLGNSKFSIDYYQREYRWEKKHVVKLIEDLTEKFLDSHEKGNERREVENYGRYFLGSVIISHKDHRRFIVDGQQRLTSITLLLIYLYRHADNGQKQQISNLVFSEKFGTRSFNLDIDERAECMEKLFSGSPFDEMGKPESVANIVARFEDIADSFPSELLDPKTLPYFADWLMENVYLVEITAYSDADAYTIFETMNDRGLSLTPTDMLKGYLLANITDAQLRNEANRVWRERIESLRELGREEDADCIKNWLRSQYAETMRDRRRGAQPGDFDLIGTEFHRWVRNHEKDLSLNRSADFRNFISNDFEFYSRWYEHVSRAAETLTEGLETVYFNAQNNFTLQYQVLLAPIKRGESEKLILLKLQLVASFIDILIARRVWNFKSTTYSTMQYAMQLLVRDIRGSSLGELAGILNERLANDGNTFAGNDGFRLHGTNRRQVHRLLARMTHYVELHSGRKNSRYEDYAKRSGKGGYQIEHIWANHPQRHKDEFDDPNDFDQYRNRIGGLVLLPNSVNASFGDNSYTEKLDYYYGENLLARSLNEKAYKHDPGFSRFLGESELPFRPHLKFKRADLESRQELYRKIAERIWNPQALLREADT